MATPIERAFNPQLAQAKAKCEKTAAGAPPLAPFQGAQAAHSAAL